MVVNFLARISTRAHFCLSRSFCFFCMKVRKKKRKRRNQLIRWHRTRVLRCIKDVLLFLSRRENTIDGVHIFFRSTIIVIDNSFLILFSSHAEHETVSRDSASFKTNVSYFFSTHGCQWKVL